MSADNISAVTRTVFRVADEGVDVVAELLLVLTLIPAPGDSVLSGRGRVFESERGWEEERRREPEEHNQKGQLQVTLGD